MTKRHGYTEDKKQRPGGRARPRGALAAVAAAGAALLLLPVWAGAQERPVGTQYRADEDPRVKFDFRLGAALPVGQLSDISDPGFSGGLGLGVYLTPRVVLRADGDVGLMGQVDPVDFEEVFQDFFEADFALYHYNAGLQFNLTDPRTPGPSFQVSFGAGATTIDPGSDNPGLSSETNFTLNGGLTVGARPSDRVSLFLRGKTYAMFMQDEAFFENGQVDFDDIWWSFPVQLGVEISFP